MLTTADSRSATAQISSHMYFCNVLGSIAPVDPPTVEQTVACLRYVFKNWRVHRGCLISPYGGMTSCSTIKTHNFTTTNGPVPKKSRKWQSSVPADPTGQPALLWMSCPTRIKSVAIGLDNLFHFVLPLSICRVGGWRSKSKWRGDQDDFVVQWREIVKREGSSMHVVWIPYYLLTILDGTKS